VTVGEIAQVIAFAICALIAIIGALGMATTMSMFRSGIFLMASFFGVAGLFILLSADLLGLLQIMMYIGGMLVMILFMVLFMHDPGGAMMAGMGGMAPIERWFSRGLTPPKRDGHAGHEHRPHHRQNSQPHAAHDQIGSFKRHSETGNGMDMKDMSMVTPVRSTAVWLAAAVGVLLIGLLLFRTAWPIRATHPNADSARQVGHLLMEKYMIAFEGAGILILIGIFGAVLMARPSQFPDDPARVARVAIDKKPLPIADAALEPHVDYSRGDQRLAQHRRTDERGGSEEDLR
jgi:NADH-quinone oxidoreductase subunit J